MGLYGAETSVGRRVKNKGNPQVSGLPKKTSVIILRKSIFQKIAVKSAKKCPSAQNLALKSRDNQRKQGRDQGGQEYCRRHIGGLHPCDAQKVGADEYDDKRACDRHIGNALGWELICQKESEQGKAALIEQDEEGGCRTADAKA